MSAPAPLDAAMRRWGAFFAGLTPDSLDDLDALAAPDVRFRDPFNDVTGRDAFKAVFRHMFEATEDPAFTVTHTARDGAVAMYRWDFTFRPKGRKDAWTISGMSEVRFTPDGLVQAHIDHWDSGRQFYGRLPVLGWLIERVRRRLAVR